MGGLNGSILQEAERLVSGDRNSDYGPAWEDYGRTAQLWSVILGVPVDPAKAALCMLAMKVSRECYKHKVDNLVDIAGYAQVVQLIEDHREPDLPTPGQRPLVYLASPYSHPDPLVRVSRFKQAANIAMRLTKQGFAVYSPILASHALTDLGMPQSWDFWKPVDERLLGVCDTLYVAMIDGWQDSVGVTAEIAYAKEHQILTVYTGPDDDWSNGT